jgi:tyrosyl-tRNA synthetase
MASLTAPKTKAEASTGSEKKEPESNPELEARIESLLEVGEECITEADLRNLLSKKATFNLYDGFEPSGRMHIAQGVFKAMNVNKCTAAGGTFIFWVADWFALMNDKMGGDLDKIKDVGQYLIEVWTAAGMDMEHVVFKWASDDICAKGQEPALEVPTTESETKENASGDSKKKKKQKKKKSNVQLGYWPQMLDIARRFNIARIKKCCQIMGRLEGTLTAAQILYPLMQCTDVFHLKADICQLGVDQRKVNMLAREYCDTIKRKLKPVILSHHMLYGLKAGQAKMSKSDPDSAIFMEDTAEDVERKIMKAYCPQKVDDDKDEETKAALDKAAQEPQMFDVLVVDELKNPCLDYIEHIVFKPPNATFEANGVIYQTSKDVKVAFLNGTLSEESLKKGLIVAINKLLEPVRLHFSKNDNGQKDLLERVQGYKREKVKAVVGDVTTRLGAGKSSQIDTPPSWTTSKKPVFAVFAPYVDVNDTMGSVLTTLKQLRSAPDGSEIVLWVPDWSTVVLNKCGADVKPDKHIENVNASIDLFLSALKAIDRSSATSLGMSSPTMNNVNIIRQSKAILSDPSGYWISVINVGRLFQLNDVQRVDPNNDTAGQVISTMMYVGDVLALAPQTICCSNEHSKLLAELAIQYYEEAGVKDLKAPELLLVKPISTTLSESTGTESVGIGDGEYFLCDDTKSGAGNKMKRAFCAPTNIECNPPLRLAVDVGLGFFHKEITIGDVTYTDGKKMEEDFKVDALTPQALKPVMKKIFSTIMDSVQNEWKTESNDSMKLMKSVRKNVLKKKK